MELLSIILAVYLYLNGSAIYYAALSNMFSKHQLIAQSITVFVVPFLGAFLVLYFSISQIDKSELKQARDKPKARLLSFLFLTFLITKNTSYGLTSDASSNEVGGSGGNND